MLDSPLVNDLIRLAIEEDMVYSDVTSEFTIPEKHESTAEFLVKEDLIVCGTAVLEMLYKEVNYPLVLTVYIADGKSARKGEIIAKIEGQTRHILAIERLSLNFLQHLSGIATLTNKMTAKAPGLKILDTRKTTPGLRILEKYAVKTGGGQNHRMSLGDMILVKNNHIDAHGSLESLLTELSQKNTQNIPVEIEIRDTQELKTAMKFRPQHVMLDNMDDEKVAEAVKYIRSLDKATKIEVSGGITEERLSKLAGLGVDYVSMGMLTNKAQSVDISLRIKKK